MLFLNFLLGFIVGVLFVIFLIILIKLVDWAKKYLGTLVDEAFSPSTPNL